MRDINIQLNELQEFLNFVNERDKQLWDKYLKRYEMDSLNNSLIKDLNQ